MNGTEHRWLARWQRRLRAALAGTGFVALFPVLVLLAHGFLGPEAVLAAAMILPALMILRNLTGYPDTSRKDAEAVLARASARGRIEATLTRISAANGMDSACIVIAIDEWDAFRNRWGHETSEDVRLRCLDRLRAVLRDDDHLENLDEGRFCVVLRPVRVARPGIRDTIAERLRAALAEPILIDGCAVRLAASAGHAPLQCGAPDPASATLIAAETALEQAHLAGPNSVRGFVAGARVRRRGAADLADEVAGALECGAIRPWFQPQVDARSGTVTGFEALARWHHPTLGLLGPGRFLDAVADAGRIDALGRAIRTGALRALQHWDRAGATGLRVSVNATEEELRGPSYAEQVAWDLDSHDLAPGRLTVEVLETVAASARDDAIIATLAALRDQGIAIDLDDFGIGQASLLSIRRFGVGRIKIDRSFVSGIDTDPGQRALVSGIVSMAREMRIATLAEGVETRAERETLCDIGCAFLQGYAIGKPMPLADTVEWLSLDGRCPADPALPSAALRPAE